VPLFRPYIVVPGELGVLGFTDVGRVFLKGESSDVWHTGVGGGVWFSFLRRANTLAVARGMSGRRCISGRAFRTGRLDQPLN
jgi:hypothetical protein